MRLSLYEARRPLGRTPLLAVLCAEREKPALPRGVELARAALSDFHGELREMRSSDALSGPAERVLLVGLGKRAELDAERLRRAAAQVVKRAEAHKLRALAIAIDAGLSREQGGEGATGAALAEGALLGGYAFTRMKSKPARRHLAEVRLASSGAPFRAGALRGRIAAEANAFARDLQNLPGNRMRPRDLAAEARKLARASGRIRCRVLDPRALERQKMGALLSVSKGSSEPCYLIHLSYKPRRAARARVALVGKGLTFDAGGISLKPAAKMDEMKFDMSGGAAVLGVFHALAELDLPIEVHGIVPTSENLPDGRANKPGDVVVARDGTTIEVLNTDAEGRLILADALAYAVQEVEPDAMIDLATLTGAVVVALGHELSGLFGNDERLQDALVAAGRETGEALWPLPLLDAHKEQMKSQVADLRNINDAGHGNGASAGAAFLSHFAGKTKWAHLDIAGTAWGGSNRDWVGGPGGSGVGVRLLLRYLESI